MPLQPAAHPSYRQSTLRPSRIARLKISFGVTAAAAVLICASVSAHAAPRTARSAAAHRSAASSKTAAASGIKYSLNLRHLHTGETLKLVYRIGNTYLPSALAKLNHFLRDSRTDDVGKYDPKEFDVLHSMLAKLHKPNAEIDVVCGYRTPWSNEFLRSRSADTGVAKNSQHIQAKAIDIRIPGVSTRRLDQIALSLHAGGVGYYPRSQFVHVDVGPVRQWTFSGHGED